MSEIDPDLPVLIAGPTGSGKSELALRIAETSGGVIVNADASQIYSCWRLLTARPSAEEESRAPHLLYGYVPQSVPYSVGDWLREIQPILIAGQRPIIVGGTGLYFTTLTKGLADIPAISKDVRSRANALDLSELVGGLDRETAGDLDLANRARVQRAWEVLQSTGRGLAQWQAETPPPLLRTGQVTPLVMNAPKEWLDGRLASRFDNMLAGGALEEVAAMLPYWREDLPAFRAIGAPELAGHLRGEINLETARERAIAATRQYARRQRKWFRQKMRDWIPVSPSM